MMNKLNWPSLRPGEVRASALYNVARSAGNEANVQFYKESGVIIGASLNCSALQPNTTNEAISRQQDAYLFSTILKMKRLVRSNRNYDERDLLNAITAGNLAYAGWKYCKTFLAFIEKNTSGNAAYAQWDTDDAITKLTNGIKLFASYKDTLPVLPSFKEMVDMMGLYYYDKLETWLVLVPQILVNIQAFDNDGEPWTYIDLPIRMELNDWAERVEDAILHTMTQITNLVQIDQEVTKCAGDVTYLQPGCRLTEPSEMIKDLKCTKSMLQNAAWVDLETGDGAPNPVIDPANGSFHVNSIGGKYACLALSGVADGTQGTASYADLTQINKGQFSPVELALAPIQMLNMQTNENDPQITGYVWANGVISDVVSVGITDIDYDNADIPLVLFSPPVVGEDSMQLVSLLVGMGLLNAISIQYREDAEGAEPNWAWMQFGLYPEEFYHAAVNAHEMENIINRYVSTEKFKDFLEGMRDQNKKTFNDTKSGKDKKKKKENKVESPTEEK